MPDTELKNDSGTDDDEDAAVKVGDKLGFGDIDHVKTGLWAWCHVIDTNPKKRLAGCTGFDLLGSSITMCLSLTISAQIKWTNTTKSSSRGSARVSTLPFT